MKVAILGLGAVGRGVLEVLATQKTGLVVTAVADSKSAVIESEGIDIKAVLAQKKDSGICGDLTLSAADIVTTADYDILVEVTPTDVETGEPALSYIKEALARGKHVVTSNKGPIALHYPELSQIASTKGVVIGFEATVCGAIPIIQTLRHGLAGNDVRRVFGVLNGTCNYILTRMADEKLTYAQALLEARELGYAEADPTYDIKGIDAAIKLVILANAVWNLNVSLNDVDCAGIDQVTTEAIALAEEEDYTIRLIAELIPATGQMRVAPRLLPRNHTLIVQHTLNAVAVETDLAGDITLIGKGAGSLETASAILSDLIFIRDFYDRST